MQIGEGEKEVLLTLLDSWEKTLQQLMQKKEYKSGGKLDISSAITTYKIWRGQVTNGILSEDTRARIIGYIEMEIADIAEVNPENRYNKRIVDKAVAKVSRKPKKKKIIDNFKLLISNLSPKEEQQ